VKLDEVRAAQIGGLPRVGKGHVRMICYAHQRWEDFGLHRKHNFYKNRLLSKLGHKGAVEDFIRANVLDSKESRRNMSM